MVSTPSVLSLFDLDPRKVGSMEEYAAFLSQGLRDRGWRSVLVFSHAPSEPILRLFRDAGALCEVCVSRGTVPSYGNLIRILRKYRAEVVHVHFYEYFSILPIVACLTRPRVLVFTDHYRQPQLVSSATKTACLLWDRVLFRLQGTKVIAISQHIKRTLVNNYGMSAGRIQVIYNGVNLHRFVPPNPDQVAELRQRLQMPKGIPVVVSVAALIPEKGIGNLLAAAKQVLSEKPDALFWIVGDGPLFEKLRREAEELRIHQNVRFTGLRSDVDRIMAAADVVAVPSTWQEPAGLVVIEAMATARPVVATRVGGIPEYLEEGATGILVEPRKPDQLARALLRLLNSPKERTEMGIAGRRRAEALFSMERWVFDTLEFYGKAMDPGKEQ